jgi:hypothetical protein
VAEETTSDKPTLDLAKPSDDAPKAKRLLPKRSFKIDKEKFVQYILQNLKTDLQDREQRMIRKQARDMKLDGWLSAKTYPWDNASNYQVPAMLIAHLKMCGTLQNALKSIRPMMEAKAKQRRNNGREQTIDNVLDFQMFVENQGETAIDNITTHFCRDEAVFATVQWVKETQTFHDLRLLKPLDPAKSVELQLLENLTIVYPNMLTQEATTNDYYEWKVTYKDDSGDIRYSTCCFYEMDDGAIQAALVTKVTTFDGPSLQVKNFEDIVFPIRSANLQPPSDTNPDGAPYYNELFTFSVDTCKRRYQDGTYHQLDDDGMAKIEASKSVAGSGDESDTPKEQTDRQEGVELSKANKREDRQGVKHYGRYDVDGDGLEEDVVAWVARDAGVLLKVELLTEVFPVIPISRPIAHASFEPTPNRVYGKSQAELLETLEDAMTTMLNQHIDYGTLTNTPFGVYRAASGLKGEPIFIEPGTMIPLDDPMNDINFPSMPQRDSAFALNTMAVLQQFVERIQSMGDTSFGRVPQGKASALRTAGTTMALLAPADDRAEQILRRLFGLFANVFQFFHALNRRYLPKQKEIRMCGMAEAGEEAYVTLANGSQDVDFEIDFEFKGSLINANKQVLSQEISEALSILVSPLAFQAGFLGMTEMYNLFRDKLKSLNLDPDKYLKRPPNPMPGPKLLAEEVISAILDNGLPIGSPLEVPEEHLQKIITYMQSPQFGFMNTTQAAILKQWMLKVQQLILQQMQLMQEAQQFNQQQNSGQGGGGGPPTTVSSNGTGPASNPPLNGAQNLDESIAPPGTQ